MSRLGLMLCAVLLLGLSGCVVSPGYCCYRPYYHAYSPYYHPYYHAYYRPYYRY
ncbi:MULTISPECIES: hypothetical protein [unclassified Pseudomonas]|uniref:hypothetical protein n=1 Tax=unclassified Pseudomonas TaxID=196821 RepID=UPI0015A386E6|nr:MULTISPECIES: hypothetical protein [unclassified Pseudomonas]NWC92505.1 hypothetical protein [Pseudomonas sp. IPO3779]NWD15879.1 hypothetical protein [Pseudomonas sp. IPO3778]